MPHSSTKQVPKQKNTQTEAQKKAYKEALNNSLAKGDIEELARMLWEARRPKERRGMHVNWLRAAEES